MALRALAVLVAAAYAPGCVRQLRKPSSPTATHLRTLPPLARLDQQQRTTKAPGSGKASAFGEAPASDFGIDWSRGIEWDDLKSLPQTGMQTIKSAGLAGVLSYFVVELRRAGPHPPLPPAHPPSTPTLPVAPSP
jgi:hypothetical protein